MKSLWVRIWDRLRPWHPERVFVFTPKQYRAWMDGPGFKGWVWFWWKYKVLRHPFPEVHGEWGTIEDVRFISRGPMDE